MIRARLHSCISAVLCAAAVLSCKGPEADPVPPPIHDTTCDFVLTHDLASAGWTKAQTDGSVLLWEDGEEIGINGVRYRIEVSGSKAMVRDVKSDKSYSCVYPVPEDYGHTEYVPSFSAGQEYVYSDGVQKLTVPMSCTCDGSSGSICMHPDASILDVAVSNTDFDPLEVSGLTVVVRGSESGISTLTVPEGAALLGPGDSRHFWIVTSPFAGNGLDIKVEASTAATGTRYIYSYSDQRILSLPESRLGSLSVEFVKSELNPPGRKGGRISELIPGGTFLRVVQSKTLTASQVADALVSLAPGLELMKPLVTLVVGKSMTVTTIAYATDSPEGGTVEASGVICYPAGLQTYDHILSIQHGTCNIDEAPSLKDFTPELAPAVNENAVVVMADYLGYGLSETPDLQHPYMHSHYTATACADMLEAAESYLDANAISLKLTRKGDGLKLIGYSQGGAATISTLQELQSRGMADRVTGVWAGGGPYDLDAFFHVITDNPETPYYNSGFIPYLIRGLSYADHLSLSNSRVYAPELLEMDPETIFSTTQVKSWHHVLGHDVRKILHADFFASPSFNGNPDVLALMASLNANSVINGPVPADVSKVHLYHSPTDNIVPYECSVNASAVWGCDLTDLEVKDDHLMAGAEFLLRYMRLWDLLGPFIK